MMHGQPLIGRDHELSQLHHVFGDTINNRGVLVLLAGEAGIGKTRLLRELRAMAEPRGHTVLSGAVPHGLHYRLHVGLIRHGRTICKPRLPLCSECALLELCDAGPVRLASGRAR
jgi:DNA-binding phage protein